MASYGVSQMGISIGADGGAPIDRLRDLHEQIEICENNCRECECGQKIKELQAEKESLLAAIQGVNGDTAKAPKGAEAMGMRSDLLGNQEHGEQGLIAVDDNAHSDARDGAAGLIISR